ncbi:MAG: MBL fold metallo-hydrolase [Chitinophagaceae bacterium]|nr:MBL fold metallo-hydrolase [Chitinophagaceae bacterium]
MALYITSLNSGSNGNCYYVGNDDEAVLIDAGISCRETEKRMNRLGLPISRVKAIFVSHEHGDHITGVAGLSKKFQLPVYITKATYTAAAIPIASGLLYNFVHEQMVVIGNLRITAFAKCHDACDPHSFFISDGPVNVGVFTDIGNACNNIVRYFKECDAVFLESNYCEDMLMKGAYPWHLKKRISGGEGHLSNKQALELFLKYKGEKLSHLILSHLSKNNNSPELVEKIFAEKAGNVKITVASRYSETPLFRIEARIVTNKIMEMRVAIVSAQQLSLF